MALRFEIKEKLIPLADGAEPAQGSPLVEALCDGEFRALGDMVGIETRRQIASLLEAESCYAEIYPDYIIGSMAVPNKKDMAAKRNLFSFYWRRDLLMFIDESGIAIEALKRVAETEMDITSTAYCLHAFLRELLVNDIKWLGDLEDEIEATEEKMLENKRDAMENKITAYRRITVRMSTYYEQFAAMALVLAANEDGLMKSEEAKSFESIVNRADRLKRRAETIREYTLTLRELHQTQINIRQNKTMQLLTIVTVIIAPLTLITGWYGMNFDNLPGLHEPWGLPLVYISTILITVCLLVWFHHKKWI